MRKLIRFAILLLAILAAPAALWAAETRTIHVLVALCDNASQGIVPVPAKIGNGDDPANNLYWGCAYGVSTFMSKHKDWQLLEKIKDPAPQIYERLVFKATDADVYMIADAYAGKAIKQTTTDLLAFAAGQNAFGVTCGNVDIPVGGAAGLLVYVGHNGLMDFGVSDVPAAQNDKTRDVAVFACASDAYFRDYITQTGAHPLVLTTNLMCPEAYTLAALAESWMKNANAEELHANIAKAYNQYQKCGLNGAKKLFAVRPR